MSTTESITHISGLRTEVLRLNADMRLLINLTTDGNLNLRDFVTLTRLLTGGNPELSAVLASVQATTAVIQGARIALKQFEIELGPVGWAILAITTFTGFIASDQLMRRPRY